MQWQLASATALPAHKPSRRVFFFSEDLPAGSRNIHAAYAPVEKLGTVLADDSPAERQFLTFCGTVLRLDDGRFRMYYTTRHRKAHEWRIAVAESSDGLAWEKIPLHQETRPGFGDNVIVFSGAPSEPVPDRTRELVTAEGDVEERSDLNRQDWVGQPQVLRLPDGRWRMYYWRHQRGWGRFRFVYVVAESEDGLQWRQAYNGEPALYAHGVQDPSGMTDAERRLHKSRRTNDANFVYVNPWLGCYEQFSQWMLDAHPDRRVEQDNASRRNRMIQRRVSEDGLSWSPPELVIQADDRDPWDQQFYHLAVQYHEDWYIGGLGHYRVENEQQTMDLELAFSRDGRTWQRPVRGGFIPRGPDVFDSEMLYPPNAWIDEGDTWLCLYSGSARKHNESSRLDVPSRRIMAARWSKNRFVGMEAGRVPGGFLSEVFYPQGPHIYLDVDIRGWLRAELCDAWGRKIEGCHLMHSAVVRGDDTAHALSWQGRDTARFIDEPVRLRLEYADGAVYGIRH